MSLYNFPYFLTDKQKTKKNFSQILMVTITISYIFCALKLNFLPHFEVQLFPFFDFQSSHLIEYFGFIKWN